MRNVRMKHRQLEKAATDLFVAKDLLVLLGKLRQALKVVAVLRNEGGLEHEVADVGETGALRPLDDVAVELLLALVAVADESVTILHDTTQEWLTRAGST